MLRIVSCLILFSLSSICNAETIKIQPFRNSGIAGRLGDIYNHTPDVSPEEAEALRKIGWKAERYCTSGDVITDGHETTHYIDARLRKTLKAQNVYYCLNSTVFHISSPNITLKQIADNIPKDKRGDVYSLYLVQAQQYRQDEPLYVLEELNGYINGCMVGWDYKIEKRSIDSYNHVLEMWEYVKVAQELSRKSGFAEQKELDEFLDFVYNNRVLWLEQEYKKLGWLK
jgi:hypothetical protein